MENATPATPAAPVSSGAADTSAIAPKADSKVAPKRADVAPSR